MRKQLEHDILEVEQRIARHGRRRGGVNNGSRR